MRVPAAFEWSQEGMMRFGEHRTMLRVFNGRVMISENRFPLCRIALEPVTGTVGRRDPGHPDPSAARVSASAPISPPPAIPSSTMRRPRARLTRLLTVPTATPLMAAASS